MVRVFPKRTESLIGSQTVVLRYRQELEPRRLSPSTISLSLAVIGLLSYKAADTGLLSPELAAGMCRVKGFKEGRRAASWLDPASLNVVVGRRIAYVFGKVAKLGEFVDEGQIHFSDGPVTLL